MRGVSRFQLILIVAVVALIAVNVFLAWGYFGAINTKADLEKDIVTKEQSIDYLEGLYNIGALTNQLAEAERKLAEEAPIPERIDPLELVDKIIYVVQKAGIDTYTFKPAGSSQVQIGNNMYTGITYTISTAERLSVLVKFLELLEGIEFGDPPHDTVRVTDIRLSPTGEIWSLSCKLVIIVQ
jgi:hypothetical protein